MAHRIGIIGLGKIAQDQHVPAIRANPAFQLVATSSTRAVTVPGVPVAHTDYRDMLAMAELWGAGWANSRHWDRLIGQLREQVATPYIPRPANS